MNAIDHAIAEELWSLGGDSWRVEKLVPGPMYEVLSNHAANFIGGWTVVLRHAELDATMEGKAATIGQAIADAVRKVKALKEEQA